MRKADWMGSTEPRLMQQRFMGKAFSRKRRLFACACARMVWDHLGDDGSRELVELFVEGQGSTADLRAAHAQTYRVWDFLRDGQGTRAIRTAVEKARLSGGEAAYCTARPLPADAARGAGMYAELAASAIRLG